MLAFASRSMTSGNVCTFRGKSVFKAAELFRRRKLPELFIEIFRANPVQEFLSSSEYRKSIARNFAALLSRIIKMIFHRTEL